MPMKRPEPWSETGADPLGDVRREVAAFGRSSMPSTAADPEVVHSTSVVDGFALVIALGRTVPVEPTFGWLMEVLPLPARQQVEEASLIILTEGSLNLMRVLRCDCAVGDYLEVRTASIG